MEKQQIILKKVLLTEINWEKLVDVFILKKI